MSDRTYDQFGHRYSMDFQLTLTGTQATAVGTRAVKRFSAPGKVVSAGFACLTGATAALPAITLAKSAAGTGTMTAFATTTTMGTTAGSAGGAFTLTETNFASGDVVGLQIATGTAAWTDTVLVNLMVEELFN